MADCHIDSDCPFLFYCTENRQCEHDPIFPLQIYPIFIYILLPIAVGLVNMTGNSMGVFKVLLFVNLLRYENKYATAFVQPAVVGAGFCNFFNIIFKKHPHRNAPLIDYNILYIMIPSSLLGSTLGSFVQRFVPEIVQDVLVIGFFSYFVKQFYGKLKQLVQKHKEEDLQQSILTHGEKHDGEYEDDNWSVQNYSVANNYSSSDSDEEQVKFSEEQLSHKDQIIKYQSSLRIKDIFISFLVYFIFEFFVFLAQGKFPFYPVLNCSLKYSLGLAGLIALTFLYLYFMKKKLRRQYKLYRKFQIQFDIDLCKRKTFMMIALGGLSAGFVQGVLGVGSGTFIMLVLLSYNIDPRVASATSGYQIFFIGGASFVQAFVTNEISLQDGLFLFGICAVLGGIVTILFYTFLKNKNEFLVRKILLIAICVLCVISVVGMIPYIIQVWMEFGFSELIKIHPC